jgi:hypothetical protein
MSMDYPVFFVIALYLVPSVANVYGLSSLVTRYRVVTNKTGQSIDTGNTEHKIQSGHKQDWSIHRHWQHWAQDTERSGLTSFICDRSVSCAQSCQCLWIIQSCLWSFCVLCPVLSMSMDWPVLFVTALYFVFGVACVYGLSSLVCDHSVSTGHKTQNDHKQDWTIHRHWQHWVQDTERSQTRLDNP